MLIENLFPEVCNLFGDPQNAAYLLMSAEGAEEIRTPLDGIPYFVSGRPDIILMGSMSESTQRRVTEKLRPYRDRISDLIESGCVFLMTGNALDVFCRSITYVTENIVTDGLGIFDGFEVVTDWFKRINGKIIGKCDGVTVTGFRSQFAEISGDNSQMYFVKADRGDGIRAGVPYEGIRYRNFIGTQILGPILPLNPGFTSYLIRLCGGIPHPAFEKEAVEAFDRRVEEFLDPSVKF